MKTFELLIRPLGPLLVGGHSPPEHGGDRSSARDANGRPMIPASALRGALRLELERLLRGRDGDLAACSANMDRPDDGVSSGGPCGCPVCRLFGVEGEGSGLLRLDDATLPEVAGSSVTMRSQVAVGRRTGSAVPQHLTFIEAVEPAHPEGDDQELRFRARGWLIPRGQDEQDLEEDLLNLQAACRALSGIGGGKARGLGWIRCELNELNRTEPTSPAPKEAKKARAVRLRFTPLAPLHFGSGRPLGTFHFSSTSAPGSTVRGAVAFCLLEHGLCAADDPTFQALVTPGSSEVSFGSASVAQEAPLVTRRKCRPEEHVFDDLLAELLWRQAAHRGLALAPEGGSVCPRNGCQATKAVPWRWTTKSAPLQKRLRTKTAINRKTGTAMDQKLYSMEVVEPLEPTPSGDGRPFQLTAEIRGLDRDGASLLAKLHGRELWLGGRKSRGMGLCRVDVEAVNPPSSADALGSIEELTGAFRAGWQQLREAVGSRIGASPLDDDERLVALILEEPWALPGSDPSEALQRGPLLAESAPSNEGATGIAPFQTFLSVNESGRFGAQEAARYGAPDSVHRGEVPPVTVVAEGSVYVYRVSAALLEERLEDWVLAGFSGGGVDREIGLGRFIVRGVDDPYQHEGHGGSP